MKYLCLFVLLLNLLLVTNNAEAQESNDVLDKIYRDILKSMPQPQRELFDSAYVMTRKNSDSNTGGSGDRGNADCKSDGVANASDAVNSELQKMIQQIDTMRNRRMIHFKSVNPVTE